MTSDGLKRGDVFYFPYLWKRQARRGVTDSKDRTCCLAFKSLSPTGARFLIILPISDQKGDAGTSLEITAAEKKRAGLDPARRAFVHIDEFNFDPEQGSFVRRSTPKVLGRFSRPFVEKIATALSGLIKLRSAKGIDRRD